MNTLCSSSWVERMSLDETISVLLDLARSHVTAAGPYRADIEHLLDSRDWAGLCNYELDYGRTADPLHVKHARQALAFFQKLEELPLNVDKEKVAVRKFYASEQECLMTNRRLRMQRAGKLCFPAFVNSVFYTAQRLIARVLGAVPAFSDLEFGFGPGATTTTNAQSVNWATKLNSQLECSSELVPLLQSVAAHAPHWFALHAHICAEEFFRTDVQVGRGRLQFVPKNAKTYRSIIVEPILNGFVQRGFGRYIRQRLKRYGVDLDDQSRNQALARSGSLFDSLATVDLSSASDTISLELVYELLPLDWASLLSSVRTSHITYKGIDHPFPLEKFSSMGNGFTFELESLIFWALSRAVLEYLRLPLGWLAVYGDDIVLPSEAVPMLREVFSYAGFTVNSAKSFSAGPFRESCGKDYFLGTDVRPYYQKARISGETLFVLHNFYMRDFDFARAKVVRRYIHPSLLIFGPDGYGDGHLIGSWAPKRGRRSRLEKARGWESVRFDTYQHTPRELKRLPQCDWALPTYCIYIRQGEDSPYDPLRIGGSDGYKRISVCTHRRGVFVPR